jgi:hypothetical protein
MPLQTSNFEKVALSTHRWNTEPIPSLGPTPIACIASSGILLFEPRNCLHFPTSESQTLYASAANRSDLPWVGLHFWRIVVQWRAILYNA